MVKSASLCLLFIIGCLSFSSCVSYKHIPYFQDLPQAIVLNQDIENQSPVVIQPNDILSIAVSSQNVAIDLFTPTSNRIIINTDVNEPKEGYLVNPQGEIQLPMIGSLAVSGLSTTKVNELITQRLKSYYKEPVVNVRLLNFKIAVFGDVRKPGIYPVNNERITVLEAIILAGDLNKEALKTNILLIREIDKKRQFIRLDIESKTIFKSPYFYLKNNDLIYIETGGKTEKRNALISNANIATAIVTFLLLLLKLK